MSNASLVNAPQDAGIADFLAGDLGGQGVTVTRGAGVSGPLLLVVGPASAGDPGLQAAAAQAAQAGRPIHVVRLGEDSFNWAALPGVASWTDAFGPAAQANVAGLAARLRPPVQAAAAPSPWAAPPPSPWGAPPAAASPPQAWAPPSPAGGNAPSDKGSLIALGVIGGFGLLLLILYLTGALNSLFGSSSTSTAATDAPVSSGPAAPAGVTDAWLSGTWKETCASREFMRLDPARGTVTFHNGAGTFTRSGSRLTIAGGGGTIAMEVAYVGPDQMRATAQGDSETLRRCG